ncbi:MAG TPA: hypothetical protein VM869_30205 [Enhygromyxa sp.]|nr:hypothetical protein [Enhygromyxa sp.]
MTSRASALACVATLASGCGAEPVQARAIWVDDFGGEGHRRIHVYDRGELRDFEVLGQSEPVERVQLDPYGRGVLVRSGDRSGAWFDFDDGRRLPLLLPPTPFEGDTIVEFADRALTWIDPVDGGLVVVPLAPGLALARREDGTVAPLTRDTSLRWTVAAARAPVVFAAGVGRASFHRYPTRVDQPLVIALEAQAVGLGALPDSVIEARECVEELGCYASVSVSPEGELAIFADAEQGPWELFDRRSPSTAGPLTLPPSLAEAQTNHDLRLLQVLDREVSIWIGPGQLHRFDRARDRVDSLPTIFVPPMYWSTAAEGRAAILSSSAGPVYRADLDGVRALSVEITVCNNPSAPVVSPDGRFVAWTCTEYGDDLTAEAGVVVRVSASGLERYVGVAMATLAIDDDGDLLLYSVESTSDGLDAVGTTSVPQTLFSLAADGTLTRVDELEPAPSPVLLGNELAAYIQGVALAEGS